MNVIEIPIDPIKKLVSTVKIGNKALNQAYSRSSYLLINNGKTYQAYILTIIADSAYVNNDLSRLSHNTFRKQDPDFSGLVLYYTPTGRYAGGYAYKDGQVVQPTTTQQTGGQKVQSVGGNLKPDNMVVQCKDWYQRGVVYNADGTIYSATDWEYIGTTCTSYDDGTGTSTGTGGTVGGSGGSGNGGSGGSPSSPPPPCPPGTNSNVPTASPCVAPPAAVESTGAIRLRIDYMPLPGSTPCSVQTAPVPCYKIITDVLKAHYPCAVSLVLNKLQQIGAYSTFVDPFSTSRKPDITWQDSSLAWAAPGVTAPRMLGNTETDANAQSVNRSAVISLNSQMLNSSSQLLIAATAIHETLHAYINYNIHTSVAFSSSSYNSAGNWLASIDAWATLQGLPSNYSNHSVMMTSYFDQAVSILAQWDNNAHTTKEYAEAMLYGLDNASGGGTPAQQSLLTAEYNTLMSKYSITASNLNSFYLNNLYATSGKLPTSGCN